VQTTFLTSHPQPGGVQSEHDVLTCLVTSCVSTPFYACHLFHATHFFEIYTRNRDFVRLPPQTPILTHLNTRSILQGGYAHPLTRTWQGKRPLDKSMFMYPIFITDDPNASVEIPSLPGQRRWGVDRLEEFLGPLVNKGLKSVILFGVPVKGPKVSATRSRGLRRPILTGFGGLRSTLLTHILISMTG